MFALCYSIYIFLTGLHNAVILEPYSVHGGGRYHGHFLEYSRLMSRTNGLFGLVLSVLLLLVWAGLRWIVPAFATRSLLGLALTAAVLLTALFVRRTLYLRRRPDLAAKFSTAFFITLALLLFVSVRLGLLNGLSVFLVVGISWIIAGIGIRGELPGITSSGIFQTQQPSHWSEHWKYARWVLATAFVFQLTNQGYYWLVAGFLSLKEVGELRAMYILTAPIDQISVALTLLVLPMMAFRHASKRRSELVSLWKLYGVFTCGIAFAYAIAIRLLCKPLMHVIYAGKFDDVSVLLGTLAFLPLIMSAGNSLNVALKSIERPDVVLYAYVASGLATFAIGIPLIMHFGLRGAVYGMLVSAGIYTAVLVVGFLVRSSVNTAIEV